MAKSKETFNKKEKEKKRLKQKQEKYRCSFVNLPNAFRVTFDDPECIYSFCDQPYSG